MKLGADLIYQGSTFSPLISHSADLKAADMDNIQRATGPVQSLTLQRRLIT
jgi:hypothetical protein